MSVDSTKSSSPAVYDPTKLWPYEVYWRDHQKWLEGCGYLLRPRYRPEWVPSWTGTKKSWAMCEDANSISYGHIIDATRVSDGVIVVLKRVRESKHPYEVEIGNYLHSEPLASDPRNHTVPMYEVLSVPDDEDAMLIVMPHLRYCDTPRFDTYGEAVGCFKQIFEGLQFMHEHLVAHRDCNDINIMMDASGLYPEGFHFLVPNRKPDYSGDAKHYTRTQRPVKYYFIDFGLSRRYKPEDMPPNEDIIRGGDKSVPEHQGSAEIANPFPTDVYCVGNMIREDFLERKYGFGFMAPLVGDMVQDDPNKRPTMDEVVYQFEEINQSLSSWKLRSRVVRRKDSSVVGLFRAVSHWTRRVGFILRRVPPIPVPKP